MFVFIRRKYQDKYPKQNGRSRRMLSIKRYQVWMAFQRPKVMKTNSNKPNGVVMVIFGISSGATRIWVNTFAQSMILKIIQP